MINASVMLGTVWTSDATGAQTNQNYSYDIWKEGKGER